MIRSYKNLLVLAMLLGTFAFLRHQVNMVSQVAACDNLYSSAGDGDVPTVIERLEEGVDPNCEGGEPLKMALKNNHRGMAYLLRRYGAKDKP